jgi:hypothetical protein
MSKSQACGFCAFFRLKENWHGFCVHKKCRTWLPKWLVRILSLKPPLMMEFDGSDCPLFLKRTGRMLKYGSTSDESP